MLEDVGVQKIHPLRAQAVQLHVGFGERQRVG
jgi:hypothetical protein